MGKRVQTGSLKAAVVYNAIQSIVSCHLQPKSLNPQMKEFVCYDSKTKRKTTKAFGQYD